MNERDIFLALKNKLRVAQWWLRWREGGGSMHWVARDLKDLRNDEDRQRYRVIEHQRRHSPFGRRVVNLNAFRFERNGQQAYKRMAVS